MALTVVKQPEEICLSKNPIWIKTDGGGASLGNKHVTRIKWNTVGGSIDDFMTISWNGKTQKFYFKENPIANGREIYYNAVFPEYNQPTVDLLKSNYELANDFDIEFVVIYNGDAPPVAINSYIQFTAREVGAEYNLTFASFTVHPTTYQAIIGGTNPTIDDAYHVKYNVFVEKIRDSKNYSNVFFGKLTPGYVESDLVTELNIQEIVNAFLNYDIPSFNQAAITRASECIKSFFIRLGEQLIVDNQLVGAIETAHFDVLKAGINARIFPSNNEFLTQPFHIIKNATADEFDVVDNPILILDWEDDEKTISPKQEEYIYLLSQKNGGFGMLAPEDYYIADDLIQTTARLLVKEYHPDGEVLYNEVNSLATFTANDGRILFIIPVGLSQGLLSPIVTSGVDKFQIYLEIDHHNPFTSNPAPILLRTYNVDYKYYFNEQHFCYSNSLSGFTTFRTFGDSEMGANISFDEFDINLPSNYTANDFETIKYNALTSEVFEVNTGFISKKEIYKMLDFLSSEKKFISIQTADESGFVGRIPILVDGNNFSLFKSEDGLFSISFKYKYAQYNKGFNTSKRFV